MNIFRYNDMWYRHRMKKMVYQKHKDLRDSNWKKLFWLLKGVFGHKNCYIPIILGVLIFFLVATQIDISWMNFLELEFNADKAIIDQRTSNIATIISINLVVVGFLINNLAIKSPTTYRLLFQKSFLYFTVYFTLTTIGFCILISLYRDTVSDFVFTRLVIAASYLVIIVLVLIGILFRKILLFTNEKVISAMMKDELLYESRVSLRKVLINKYSTEQYYKLFEAYAEREFQTISLADFLGKNIEEEEFIPQEEYEIIDVNVWLMKIFLKWKKSKTDDIYYTDLSLDMSINKNKEIIWSNDKPNKYFAKWILSKCIVTRKKKETKQVDTYRKEYDQKILQLAEESKYQNLELQLDAILSVYELQMKNK